MNQRYCLITAVLLLIALLVLGTVSAAETDTDNTIVASGTGSVIGTPDRAQISLAVETENQNVKAAQAENAARMTKVMDALIAAGIPKEALKTTGYNIYPVYEDTKIYGLQKVKTYRVTNTLTVTLHDVSRTGEVIDIGVAEGINQASSIQFFLSDEQSQVLRTEALKEASERASADARTVAGALGVSIQSVKSAQISGGYSPVRYQNYAMAESVGGGVSTPIEAGDITVTATVTVTYLIG
ncbi:MAG: oxidative stress defense protein [Methanoregulaceae archaeon PtaU1.Bin222]|nr:MAG: oxidative stress defense protein [Methanoregulaceae archaeon PtaU1.Bin222]